MKTNNMTTSQLRNSVNRSLLRAFLIYPVSVYLLCVVLNSGSLSAQTMPNDQCRSLASKRADKILRTLNAANAPSRYVVRPLGDRCLGQDPTQFNTLVLRQFWTDDNDFYQEFIFPSGTRRFLSFTLYSDSHTVYHVTWLCTNGGARVSEVTDEINPLGSASSNDVESPPNIVSVICSTFD
jgi:hypothetical protein